MRNLAERIFKIERFKMFKRNNHPHSVKNLAWHMDYYMSFKEFILDNGDPYHNSKHGPRVRLDKETHRFFLRQWKKHLRNKPKSFEAVVLDARKSLTSKN
jgi:hypothetical protein